MLHYLFIAFISIAIIQFIYHLFIFGNFAFVKNKKSTKAQPPVSVIICAKNEAENLKTVIPRLLNQEYPKFELVLINDRSIDNTAETLDAFAQKSSLIKIVNVAENEHFWGNKKYALTLGIKASSYEHLLFTGADCQPSSKNWISQMSTGFSNSKNIVLGYGAYKKVSNSLINKLIRFESLLTAIQYFSYAKIGIPYMGVGRNLAYTKDQFFNAKGFANHLNIKHGDDYLFVNQVANKENTAICLAKDSFTYAKPEGSINDWLHQKRHHISTAKHFKPLHKYLLGLFSCSQILFWLVGGILLLTKFQMTWVVTIIAARFLILYFIIGFSAKKLQEKDLILLSPLYELFLILLQMIIFIRNLFSKPTL